MSQSYRLYFLVEDNIPKMWYRYYYLTTSSCLVVSSIQPQKDYTDEDDHNKDNHNKDNHDKDKENHNKDDHN